MILKGPSIPSFSLITSIKFYIHPVAVFTFILSSLIFLLAISIVSQATRILISEIKIKKQKINFVIIYLPLIEGPIIWNPLFVFFCLS